MYYLDLVHDYITWLEPYLNVVSKHSQCHSFQLRRDVTGAVAMFVKRYRSSDSNWCGDPERGVGFGYHIFSSCVAGVPEVIEPNLIDETLLDNIYTVVSKIKQDLSSEQLKWYEKLISSAGAELINQSQEVNIFDIPQLQPINRSFAIVPLPFPDLAIKSCS